MNLIPTAFLIFAQHFHRSHGPGGTHILSSDLIKDQHKLVLFCSLSLITFMLFASACGGSVASDSQAPEITSNSSMGQVMDLPASVPPISPGQHLTFGRISSDQGLSQNTVFRILQDSDGFMWFGTEDGLNRYDGYNFTIYRHDPDDPTSLSDNRILSIIQDRSGVLWIGTANSGLNKIDLEANQITRYQNDPAASSWLTVLSKRRE